jgi:hypothetical protein
MVTVRGGHGDHGHHQYHGGSVVVDIAKLVGQLRAALLDSGLVDGGSATVSGSATLFGATGGLTGATVSLGGSGVPTVSASESVPPTAIATQHGALGIYRPDEHAVGGQTTVTLSPASITVTFGHLS